MKDFKNYISANDSQFLKELEELFINDFLPTTENVIENIDYKDSRIELHVWENVKAELKKAASKIDVQQFMEHVQQQIWNIIILMKLITLGMKRVCL